MTVPYEHGRCYSDAIFLLKDLVEAAGAKVHIYDETIPETSAGVYRSETHEIFVRFQSARDDLLTLAHEIGHWVGWRISGHANDTRSRLHRERQAVVYGWRALVAIGAAGANGGRLGITRSVWLENNVTNFEEPVDSERFPY